MGIIIWLLVGGLVGWLAGIIIVVGIVGAFIGGAIFARGDINTAGLTVSTFAVSILGAVILLAVVNLFRRGRLR
jgi:uncharacterized membrane protein YeaQ/YmgE (transglycosylase-associated protein family)